MGHVTTTNEVLRELTTLCATLGQEGEDRLPPERTLAKELNASRSTVRRALRMLAQDGVITVARGRSGGAFLVDLHHPERVPQIAHGCNINRRLTEIAGYNEMLLEQGIDVGNRVLALELENPEAHIAAQLEIDVAEPVVSLLRLRLADCAPLSLERMYLSFRRFPTLLDEGLGGAESMYGLLEERYGVSIASVEEQIEIGTASPQAAHLLAIEPGDAVLAIQRLARDTDDLPVECSFDIFRGDRTSLTVRMIGRKSRKTLIRQAEDRDLDAVRTVGR